jgi:hypothetical protein
MTTPLRVDAKYPGQKRLERLNDRASMNLIRDDSQAFLSLKRLLSDSQECLYIQRILHILFLIRISPMFLAQFHATQFLGT